MSETAATAIASVVIGKNEGPRLEETLRSVLRILPNTIYVDSASTDGSVECARALGVIVVELDRSRPMNASRGRAEGTDAVRKSFPRARFIQFLDGDCVLQPDWTDSAFSFIEARPSVAVVCGRRFEKSPHASLYNRLADDEWNTPTGRANACGGDAMMRIAAIHEVGGFNPALHASEEPELSGRLRAKGWEIWRLDTPMTEHDAAIFTFGQWWRRTTRSGYGYAQAWDLSRDLPERVNTSLLKSAFLWSAVVPATILVLSMLFGRAEFLAAIPVAYAAQIARMTAKRKDRSAYSWLASSMLLLAKLPEAIGALKFFLGGKSDRLADYKAATR